jgi:two-component system chemotaxis sensor kinase CheA
MSEDRSIPQELDRKLSQLGARMALCEGDNRDEVLALAEDFSSWLSSITGLPSFPAGLLGAQARQVLQGLKSGRPVEQVCQRLSQAMAEAVHHMGRILADKSDSVTTLKPSRSPDDLETGEKLFLIPPEDLTSFQDFAAEAPDHLQAIESGLLALIQGETWDPLKVYRPFHTLKGICGFMGLSGLTRLAHQAEAILEAYKNGLGKPSEKEIDLLLGTGDLVKKQVELISQGLALGRFPLVDVETLLAKLSGKQGPEAPEPVFESKTLPAEERHAHIDRHLRIGVEKMDILLEMVGELAICQSQVTEGIVAMGVVGHLSLESSRLAKISRQLQEIVLSLRMVPVQPLFQRMSRLARDLSQKTQKPLKVELEGGETELDKRMIEELVDPLVHLIRNAVDHGIETEETRKRAGKDSEARLFLRAGHQGGDFVLRVEDDGAGLSFEKLEQKGMALGYLTQGIPTRDRLMDLIFQPGFSTAEQVTEVSGRGVGLDAVKRKIQSLKGAIQVESQPGKGTSFILRIPLTMALIEGIVVRVGSARYILPSLHVRQFLALKETESHQVATSQSWLTTSSGHIPIVELSEWFGCKSQNQKQAVVVHVEVGDREACLVVDEVVGKQQVVVKGLGEHLQGMPGLAGGAILGDGQVGFILDLNALVQGGRSKTALTAGN